MQVGEEFNLEFTVTGEVYKGFIHVFKDENPLHTHTEFALKHGFQGKVMHGNILNGFISYFVGECLPIKNVIIHSQSIHFKLPVFMNETLKFNAKIEEFFESVQAIRFKFYFENGAGKKVAKGDIQIGIL